MKQLILSAIIIASASFFSSCSKVGDTPPTPQQVDSVKIFGVDSSELVKSVTAVWSDSTDGGADSTITYLYYDTVDRKIFVAPTPISAPNPPNYSQIYSYNSSYQLSNLQTNPNLVDTGDAVSIDFTYDNANIINREVSTHKDGIKETTNFINTSLPSGGYHLDIYEPYYIGNDSSLNTFNFDINGRLVSWSVTTLPATNPWLTDSIVYDGAGNISTVTENDSFYTSQVNSFQMTSRGTKGSELSILNKILYNGISQLPDATDGNFEVGSVLNGFNNSFFYQFTNYPAASVKVYQAYSNSYVTFSPDAQFDSKNRLVSVKLYNGDLGNAYYETVKLSYYK